jgi:hypothetical protein
MAADWVNTQTFINTFDNNLQLLTEVRDYLQTDTNKNDNSTSDPMAKLTATREASRLTAMLAETMAWLLLNKAMNNDELELDQVLGESVDLCEIIGNSPEDTPSIDNDLPEQLQTLYQKSITLFADVHWVLAQARAAAN